MHDDQNATECVRHRKVIRKRRVYWNRVLWRENLVFIWVIWRIPVRFIAISARPNVQRAHKEQQYAIVPQHPILAWIKHSWYLIFRTAEFGGLMENEMARIQFFRSLRMPLGYLSSLLSKKQWACAVNVSCTCSQSKDHPSTKRYLRAISDSQTYHNHMKSQERRQRS